MFDIGAAIGTWLSWWFIVGMLTAKPLSQVIKEGRE